ncbi:MAG TPA: hypothetical protein VFT79_05820 [Solirubrobacterales bacterium]|nr:hypothetical protein [Solirubrobacterales bacterium]
MKRLKGPELKMPDLKAPDLKVPPFLADVYYDLRERRLLPVVALVAVAIVAMPFLLGGGEEPMPVETPEQAAESVRLEVEDGSALTVVEANPGLRDYRKRLRARTPTDPFRQLHTGVPATSQLKSVGSGAGGGSVTGAPETAIPTAEEGSDNGEATGSAPASGGPVGSEGKTPSEGSTGSKGGHSGGGGGDEPKDLDGKRFFGFRPDVRFGVAGSEDLNLYEDLALGSLLPKKKPLLVFIGVSESGERAAFDVSPEVTLVRGNGACIGGMQSCRLLFLREDEAVDLLTESAGRTFRLKIESIDFVEVDVPKQATGSGSASGSRQPRSLGFDQNFSK